MREVFPIDKADIGGPGPRCQATGEPKRDCKCYTCRGRRSRRKGKRAQSDARRGLERTFGVPAGATVATVSHEENWRLPVRAEVKSGRMAATVGTFYRATRDQSEISRAHGDSRPFMAVARVDGDSDPLVVLRMSHLEELFATARR